jgi:hypothetical protein
VNSTCYCHNLIVESTGILQNHASTNYTLNVGGYLNNMGVVRDNSHYLNIYLSGDLNNESSIANHSLTFTLAGTQHITLTQAATFAPTYLYGSTGAVGTLVADDDLVLTSVGNFDGNGGHTRPHGRVEPHLRRHVALRAGHCGRKRRGTEFHGLQRLPELHPQQLPPAGHAPLLWNHQSVRLHQRRLLYNNNVASYSVSTYGTFENNGTVASNPSGYNLNMYVYGNLTNNEYGRPTRPISSARNSSAAERAARWAALPSTTRTQAVQTSLPPPTCRSPPPTSILAITR